MLLLDRKNAAAMRAEEKTLPFKRDSLVLWLDPFLPEADADWLQAEIEYWIGRDQRIWVANNPAHLGMLRGRGLTVIAGPYLYAFNSWAAAFLLGEGARFIVPPLEISKQDFQRVSEVVPPTSWMPVVFAYPALFRLRADLSNKYDFRFFSDRDKTLLRARIGGRSLGRHTRRAILLGRPHSLPKKRRRRQVS